MPATEYRRLLPDQVTDATRVGNWTAIPLIGASRRIRLLGIDRFDFPRVAYWRDDYAEEPLGAMLNRLGEQRESLLVTPHLLDLYGLAIGDAINLDVVLEDGIVHVPFVIAGTFDQFPTMYEDTSSVALPTWTIYLTTSEARSHTISGFALCPRRTRRRLSTDLRDHCESLSG